MMGASGEDGAMSFAGFRKSVRHLYEGATPQGVRFRYALLVFDIVTVLFIIATLRRTGPVNILFDLIKYMDRSIYNTRVLTLCEERGDSRWSEFKAEGVTVSGMNLGRGLGFLMSAPRLRRVVGEIKPDVVHCIGFRADVLAAVYLNRYPKISSRCCCRST